MHYSSFLIIGRSPQIYGRTPMYAGWREYLAPIHAAMWILVMSARFSSQCSFILGWRRDMAMASYYFPWPGGELYSNLSLSLSCSICATTAGKPRLKIHPQHAGPRQRSLGPRIQLTHPTKPYERLISRTLLTRALPTLSGAKSRPEGAARGRVPVRTPSHDNGWGQGAVCFGDAFLFIDLKAGPHEV
ncbi:uncharacterized protein B0I36DRAFT_309525 [Microdochium trichocladiopsis]|uniref:Uncharacterized protein n=1 Tax=Microdochium trichocladiopsis TaxID=1682393 RepID=A0A9P9BV23_9PEZI|nr:uncharacterized protein B0I36DRAFT_309525 [Microdochium trichocladiopsis]KAH7039868.1 hypothetical protein B0I36DRAFT_309525 [Microdochium trichocladiopsis]